MQTLGYGLSGLVFSFMEISFLSFCSGVRGLQNVDCFRHAGSCFELLNCLNPKGFRLQAARVHGSGAIGTRVEGLRQGRTSLLLFLGLMKGKRTPVLEARV